ncbi:integrase arm-type DNA-binding domain-containing protein [Pseudomonas sp. TH39(2020)]|uniref:integrase arm-type DNA-binding domain-containing protein n=1 Tax=Pseudomonas sp. TH39(2020) TaxID=2796349 RepID=UPI00406C31C6
MFRYKIAGKSRDMGLDGSPEVSLAKAREKAAEARKLLGIDPSWSVDIFFSTLMSLVYQA